VTAGRRSLAVNLDMPSSHRSFRQASGFEESAVKQPSINA
jgi:hypothetical protein